MALVCSSLSLKLQFPAQGYHESFPSFPSRVREFKRIIAFRVIGTKLFCLKGSRVANNYGNRWSFREGSRLLFLMQDAKRPLHTKRSATTASWITSTQLASYAFTLGTAAVLPFYTLMVLAPKADLTKRSMESSIPYVVLGILYAYLLYLSWTPDTIRLMFASKYWLPELPGIAKMFSNEMTLASAWIHLLAVDLFAARQVYHDGLKNEIETRHSVSLCLLFCPIGILSHVFTKVFTSKTA